MKVLGLIASMILAALFTPSLAQSGGPPTRVLITVGGTGYNTTIVRTLRADPDIELIVRDIDTSPELFSGELLSDIDAILMYHRDNDASPKERKALTDFVQRGGGVVVLHHALANYQNWPEWWKDHVGGLYVLHGNDSFPPSQYFLEFLGTAVSVENETELMLIDAPWRYRDEGYHRLWVSDEVEALLRTNAFGSDELIAWIGPSKTGRVLYFQPGHGEGVMRDPQYHEALRRALFWTASGQKNN